MSTALAPMPDVAAIEQVLVNGDLAKLNPAQRLSYYNHLCDSLGLNPLTKPFEYITLNGKLTLYAKRDATDQLRNKRHVSVTIVARELVEDCYIVTARGLLPNGRQDESIGAVTIAGLKGEARANAMMKAETKAKRRVTLSICGLGLLDETEVESIQAGPSGGYSVEAPAAGQPATPGSLPALNPAPATPPSVPNGGDSGVSNWSATPTPAGSHLARDLNLLYIERVETRPTKNANVTKGVIFLSSGEEVTTIKTQLIALCQQLCQDNEPVTVETAKTRWGTDLLAVHRVEGRMRTEAEIDAAPMTDEEIPF